jgi:molybdenum cofactor cytidylyltransferase
LDAWRRGGDSVNAAYHGSIGHPFVFGRRLFPELAALHGDKAAWKLIDRYRERVRTVELGRLLPADIDTPADYRALAQAGEEPGERGEHEALKDE